jgi:hypothetical protein
VSDIDNIVYFGTGTREVGHYAWAPGAHPVWASDHYGYEFVDGRFAPREEADRWGRRPELPEGRAVLAFERGMTILAFWDRSGPDKRGGCNSAFIAPGLHTWEEMLDASRRLFPWVWARITFPVTLYQDRTIGIEAAGGFDA